MESIKLVRSSGFFLSSIVTVLIGIMLLEIIKSTEISLFWMTAVIPVFFGSLILRSRVWLSFYRGSGNKVPLYLFTALALIPAGSAVFVLFAVYVSSQLILLNLAQYAGVGTLVIMSAVWSAYSLMEFTSIYRIFSRTGFFTAAILLIAAVVVIDASLAFVLKVFVYSLPIGMFILAASTATTGFGLLLGKEKIQLG